MIYSLIFYWAFAALFTFGAVYYMAKSEERDLIGVFIACLVLGGILFPIFLGRNLHIENYT